MKFADGTELTFSQPFGLQCWGRALCPDGVVRAFRGGTADTFFSIPVRLKARGKTVSGYVTTETREGSSVATESDPALVKFIPYRYGKNWSAVYPNLRIYDNGGRSFDRYTVFFPEGYALGIGETGNVPNGFCQHVEALEGSHLGERITLEALPIAVQRAIDNELDLIRRERFERLAELLAIKAESERLHGDTSDMSAEEEAELKALGPIREES